MNDNQSKLIAFLFYMSFYTNKEKYVVKKTYKNKPNHKVLYSKNKPPIKKIEKKNI